MIKSLTTEEVVEGIEELFKYINEYFPKERQKKIVCLFEDFQAEMQTAPASSKKHFHSAYIGGWLIHTLNVIKAALKMYKVWEEMGTEIDFTQEELVFSAMFHDFGKLGDEKGPHYIMNNSKWHRDRGMLYDLNKDIQYMKVPERSLYLLQKYNIPISQNEFLGIKLSDGPLEEGNKAYYGGFWEGQSLKSNLPIIVHMADYLSARLENGQQLVEDDKNLDNIKKAFTF